MHYVRYQDKYRGLCFPVVYKSTYEPSGDGHWPSCQFWMNTYPYSRERMIGTNRFPLLNYHYVEVK